MGFIKGLLRGLLGAALGGGSIAMWLLWDYPPKTAPGQGDSAALGMGIALMALVPLGVIIGFMIGVYFPVFLPKRKKDQ